MTVSAADELTDMRVETLTTGGSANAALLGISVSLGGEASVPIAKEEIKNSSLTGSLSLGTGTPGEGHAIYTDTKLISLKEEVNKIPQETKNKLKQVLDSIIDLFRQPEMD